MLEPIDSLMLTAELVSSPMHVAALLILTPPQDGDVTAPKDYVNRIYEEMLAADIGVDRRLRRIPHRGVDSGFMWVWRDIAGDSGELDIRHHFQRRTLPKGSGMAGLWEMVADLHALRLERSAPMWMMYLIDGLPDGRFAFYIKIHHIVADGIAGLQMITASLSADPNQRGLPPFYADRTPEPARDAERKPGSKPLVLSALRALTSTASAGVALPVKVAQAQVSGAIGALLTPSIVVPFSAPATRFNTRLGPYRAVAFATFDRARFRAVQDAAGVTANDVVMTVIAGALRGWLAEHGELPQRSLVALCPVTVRSRASAINHSHGNQFGMGLCPLGTDIEDGAQRLELIHHGMANVKKQVVEQGPAAMLVSLSPAIGPTLLLPLLPFDTKVPPSFNVPISSVPGPKRTMYFNGARVDEIYPVSAIWDGIGLNVTLCSYAEKVGFGYVADRDVMPDVDTMIPLTEQALRDLEAAVGVEGPGSC